MRLLLFFAIWVLSCTQAIQAQTIQDTWGDMETFVLERMEQEIPEETQIIKGVKNDFLRESGGSISLGELQEQVRRPYWENVYMTENRDRLVEERKAKRKEADANRSFNGASNNPDLTTNCAINIVVVVDRSGSIDNVEGAAIQAGLLGFIGNMVGTGNTVTFVGMSTAGGAATTSATVTYNPGNTAAHNAFVNGLTFSGNNDSWSSGLGAAAGFGADLVLIIADGDDGHGAGEPAATCAAANALKSNGANNGTGAHLFAFGQGTGGAWQSGSLVGAISNAIDPNPVQANNPPTMPGISTTDFVDFGNNFNNLAAWLSVINPGVGDVETTSIWPRTCILHDFTIRGTYDVCAPLTATSLVLRFFNTNGQSVTVPATLNNDGTWTFTSTLGDMVALGLSYGTWYDVEPILTLSDGSVITGLEFIAGANNDLYFADQSDPIVTLNSSPTSPNPDQNRFCEGDPIYYHGEDPLSSNHYSAIRKRPIGSSNPFAYYQQVGWLSASLDGYNGDLNAQYPGYFEAGWEYELTIASSNTNSNVCIAWTPVKVVFEVVDCCMPDFTFRAPDCVEDGVPFEVHVTLDAPISPDQIELIYSNYPNFTYIDHTATQNGGSLDLVITFVSNSCTCVGEMLVFDIILEGCSETIWIMTDKLPCCASECKKTEIVDWNTGDCILVNGKPARKFCLEVASQNVIQGVYAGTNNATCQVDLLNLQITQVNQNGTTTICGIMVFQDPTCTGHAVVSLILDMGQGCCTIERPFSFPGGCVIDEGCLGNNDPNIEIIYGSQVQVSLGAPQGATVTVTDHVNGGTTTQTVGTVTCGPFGIDQNGTIFGGSDCNGIVLTGPENLDCRANEENPHPSFLYHFEITWGECVWVIIGDYCNELIVYRSTPNDGGGKEKRSSQVESIAKSNAGNIKVFPNPVDASGMLNFDLTDLGIGVKEIRVTDVHGKVIESFLPATDAPVFQHRLEAPLQHGLYFIIFHLNDGTVSSTRLVATE